MIMPRKLTRRRNITLLEFIAAGILCLMCPGCSDEPGEKSAVDETVNYFTGKTQIEQGKRAAREIRSISKERDEDIKELGF